MDSVRPSRTEEIAAQSSSNAISFDNQIKSEGDLRSRVSSMKRYLESLKSQLDMEKQMLQKEKLEMYNYTAQNPDTFSMASLSEAVPKVQIESFEELLLPSSRQHLKDIENKCNMELERLEKYVENIQDLKSYWQCMKPHPVETLQEKMSTRSLRSLKRGRRMHGRVPSEEWLNKNRTFI